MLFAVWPPLCFATTPHGSVTLPGSRSVTGWKVLCEQEHVGKLFLARGSSQSFISCFPAAASHLLHPLSSMLRK